MNLFHTVLFATDFSEHSREAFRIACAMLEGDRAGRLIVMHVVERTYLMEESIGFGELGVPIPVAQTDATHLHALRDRLADEYVPSRPIAVEYEVCEGDPVDEILSEAAEENCDLIVLGTHGRSGVTRLLAGSVAESVMRKATCPVLTLRRTPAAEAAPEFARHIAMA